ncbi:Tripartite-type tricarboxylate transporter, receptor component TctC [Cognatishimia maritima]|uniref:Tripartite-type tricarboxylate transporter, receptor component TctC n=2 Tax=Cognatishimia maritima TaxID=870908 RepID=A0A1M5QVR5_9RHOB|nr:Tripartite-type tricarboxylate transporter, receptor component TctC [Cognatishimia maritima]
MKMKHMITAALTSIVMASPALADWPEKPIQLIVPWGAGGATDQVTRVVASELEEALGQSIVVVNQPGASGSIGSQAAWDAPHDGYTWTAGAAKDLGTYAVTGKMDTSIKDWDLYLNSALASVISVPADSDIDTIEDFVEALKAGGLSVGTSGVNSAGHSAIEAISNAVGGSYIHATYDGGAAAVLSTVSGETQATTQLISEQIDMLRGGKLKPIAILSDGDADVPGVGVIPSISGSLPDVPVAPIYFGIFVPGDVPEDVSAKIDAAWAGLATSEALAEYTEGRGSLMTVHSGAEAQEKVWSSIQLNAWLLHDAGTSVTSPEDLGIPRP